MSAPYCNACEVQTVPLLDNSGKQMSLPHPKATRSAKYKRPAWACPECDGISFEAWRPEAAPDHTIPREMPL